MPVILIKEERIYGNGRELHECIQRGKFEYSFFGNEYCNLDSLLFLFFTVKNKFSMYSTTVHYSVQRIHKQRVQL